MESLIIEAAMHAGYFVRSRSIDYGESGRVLFAGQLHEALDFISEHIAKQTASEPREEG